MSSDLLFILKKLKISNSKKRDDYRAFNLPLSNGQLKKQNLWIPCSIPGAVFVYCAVLQLKAPVAMEQRMRRIFRLLCKCQNGSQPRLFFFIFRIVMGILFVMMIFDTKTGLRTLADALTFGAGMYFFASVCISHKHDKTDRHYRHTADNA